MCCTFFFSSMYADKLYNLINVPIVIPLGPIGRRPDIEPQGLDSRLSYLGDLCRSLYYFFIFFIIINLFVGSLLLFRAPLFVPSSSPWASRGSSGNRSLDKDLYRNSSSGVITPGRLSSLR
jgi:hypothetical protein